MSIAIVSGTRPEIIKMNSWPNPFCDGRTRSNIVNVLVRLQP